MQLLRGMERMEAIYPSWILIVCSKGHHLVNIWNEEPWKWVGKGGFYCGECPQGFFGIMEKVVVIAIMLFRDWNGAAFPSLVQ